MAKEKRKEALSPDCKDVEEALLQNALKGNATAQMFWLKNRYPEKWNDKRADERDPMEEVRAISDANRKAAEEQLKGEN